MPSVFNIARACIYVAVLLWTVVCLAIAGHFQSRLISSDLTHFVPFAIFVCVVSILVMGVLLGFTFKRSQSPISTKIELACLGLVGTFWLALGAFLVTSESETADVECFSDAEATTPVDVSDFSTATYQAQYHVLEAFSLFNAILIWGFGLLLLGCALRFHFAGRKHVWNKPATTTHWFRKITPLKELQLPAPVTSGRVGRTQSRSRPQGPTRGDSSRSRGEKTYNEKATPIAAKFSSRRDQSVPPLPALPYRPQRAHTSNKYDKFHREASPRR
ncbi:hypothetical protein OE88DRAFT_1731374 [Heliocybe sulcata]|uniref:MARVEL domain-containing protein n=1 Tax=Heliocybe sulcata TaxID=5364 RepID=A0A5C3NFL7_9AGAM|nr:hypothetical protein OE88DRAFT_1731374 [Heliocybe sulcata]